MFIFKKREEDKLMKKVIIEQTFAALHALHEDTPALRQHPVAPLVAVLSKHHGAQGMRRFKELAPDLVLLLGWGDTHPHQLSGPFWPPSSHGAMRFLVIYLRQLIDLLLQLLHTGNLVALILEHENKVNIPIE